jgi:RNA polymerase sigma-70 factor (ECF subfamily)
MKNREGKISEIEIINGLKNNDNQVHTYLYNNYINQLTYFGYRIIDNKEEAKEIAHNTLTKFFQRENNFETSGNIKAYLYVSVRNACLTYLKTRQREKAGQKEYINLLNEGEDKTTAVIEGFEIESALLNKIYTEVESLPEKCREVFKLSYFMGLSNTEISERLNITLSTIRSHRSNALTWLRIKLFGNDL